MLRQRLSDRAANAEANAVAAILNGGLLRLYAGEQRAEPEASPGRAVLLAELRFAERAFCAASGGIAEANPFETGCLAVADGVATWFAAVAADGTAIFDGSVGTREANLVLNDVEIREGDEIAVDEFRFYASKR